VSDANTLPDLNLPLRPVPRRYVKPTEPAAKRAAPAAIGAGTLAAAAIALFFVPLPEVQPTRPSQPAAEESSQVPVQGDDPGLTDTSGTADTDTAAGAAGVAQLPEETTVDPATEAALIAQVQSLIQETWSPETLPAEPLSYRITTSAAGDILGYKYENGSEAALDYADQTPLPELTYLPVNPAEPVDEPVAQFRVVFNPDGQVEVAPWTATEATDPASSRSTGSASPPPTASNIDSPIETPIDQLEPLRQLNKGLRDAIAIAWENPAISQDQTYRVRLNADGDVLGYEAIDAPAAAPAPLADLVTPGNTTGPQADFKVVFTEAGVVEVSPWDGWPD
ncbi:hypothetical protein C7271_21405, partial [filamentous cyanobacterium CCP5]